MKYKNEFMNLSQLPYFDVVTMGNLLDLSDNSLRMYITRSIAGDKLVRLKRGLYVTKDYYEREKINDSYIEFVSNVIYGPSYISSSYVLQKYSVLSESVYSITAMTTKKPFNIINNLGSYMYTNISSIQFIGFQLVKKDKYIVREATLAKALYDYLLFATKSWKKINNDLVDGLRLNLADIDKDVFGEFSYYVLNLGSQKMKKIEKIICNR